MGLISDERGALVIENQASGLSSSGEGHLHLSLCDLINLSISGNGVEVALVVLGGAEEGDSELEEFLVIGLDEI